MSPLSSSPLSAPSSRRELGTLLRSVVKVLCVSDAPDYEQPWQTQGPSSGTGSGAVLQTSNGLRVLTNAHCVADHAFVQVRRYGLAQKYEAEVEAIGHDCDLALLRVDDPSFFLGITPIEIGPLPKLSARVSVCGFPIGGERLSITEGIVSRIELVHYSQSHRRLLAVQIDAAINSGNSGGPVFWRGKLAGVAFQALDEAEQIGYMIAPPVVQHFLSDVAGGTYGGYPVLGVTTQSLEAQAHRQALGLPKSIRGGRLITRVAYGSSAHGLLESGDVITALDGVNVAADATMMLREGELIDYSYIVSRRHVGERLKVAVWRRRKRRSVEIELRAPQYLVPEERYDVKPVYFVVGGLLFAPLTRNYLMTWGESWPQTAPRYLVSLYENGICTAERHQVVMLQKVLPDSVNKGYHDLESIIVVGVGGKPVRGLADLIKSVEAARGRFLRFSVHDGREIVLDRKKARERSAAILARFGVPHDRSPDLRPGGASNT